MNQEVFHIDLFSTEFKANPYPTYAYLREHAPVYRATLPDGLGVWLVSRYADVVSVLKDSRFVKDIRNAMTSEELKQLPQLPEVVRDLKQNMLDLDNPDHARLRALVHKGFTPRRIEQLRGRVQQIANELLDKAEAKGTMDLIAEYAFPLPITVIMELLGLPAEDQAQFRAWSEQSITGNAVTELTESQLAATGAIVDYLKELVEVRRKHPEDDLITALVQAEEAGDRLNVSEMLAMMVLLLIAGHETTSNLIGNGMLALFQAPDQLERLRREPDLMASAIEELLRFSGPLETATERFASEDIELAGAIIPRGEMVLTVLAAANRDPQMFANPDMLDIARKDNPHVAFGQGIHFCLGAPLARLEGQIGLATLLQRFPRLELNAPIEEITWRPSLVLRGLSKLSVKF